MCDEHTLDEELDARRRHGWTRRDFNLLAFTSAAVALLPGEAIAAEVRGAKVNVKTPDGVADCYFVHPAQGRHPAVLMWPDYFGMRAAYEQLAQRLAQSGYAVLVINPYYRGKKAPVVAKVDFKDKAAMELLGTLSGAITDQTVAADSRAFVAFLDTQRAVDKQRKIGAIGYCMSGAYTLHAAATVPGRIGAIASFHGGGLVTKDPDSPHLVIPKLKVQALIAIAEADDKHEPATRAALNDAFAKAGVPAEIEVYPAKHGWCTPDMVALYDEVQAKRAWGRLLALFERALS
jgi:carboxymethylenebutenolidase